MLILFRSSSVLKRSCPLGVLQFSVPPLRFLPIFPLLALNVAWACSAVRVLVFPWHQQNSGVVWLQQCQAAKAVPRCLQLSRNVICVVQGRMGCCSLGFFILIALIYLHIICLEFLPPAAAPRSTQQRKKS